MHRVDSCMACRLKCPRSAKSASAPAMPHSMSIHANTVDETADRQLMHTRASTQLTRQVTYPYAHQPPQS